jgi:excisionase family DNA binding protein
MELDNFMTAREFAHLVNTPYPTVAQWLRDGRIPGAVLTGIGHMKVWMIPKESLKDFRRPEMGRPKKSTETGANGLPFGPLATSKLVRKVRAKKPGVKKFTKKISPKK